MRTGQQSRLLGILGWLRKVWCALMVSQDTVPSVQLGPAVTPATLPEVDPRAFVTAVQQRAGVGPSEGRELTTGLTTTKCHGSPTVGGPMTPAKTRAARPPVRLVSPPLDAHNPFADQMREHMRRTLLSLAHVVSRG